MKFIKINDEELRIAEVKEDGSHTFKFIVGRSDKYDACVGELQFPKNFIGKEVEIIARVIGESNAEKYKPIYTRELKGNLKYKTGETYYERLLRLAKERKNENITN